MRGAPRPFTRIKTDCILDHHDHEKDKMKRTRLLFVVLAALALILSACGTSAPEAAPLPSEMPTQTPQPAPSPTAEVTPEEARTLTDGYISFRTPDGYVSQTGSNQVNFKDTSGNIIFSLYDSQTNPDQLSGEALVNNFLGTLFKKSGGAYQVSATHEITVDGATGTAYDLSGTLSTTPFEGQAVILMPDANRYLFGLGMANLQQDTTLWKNGGSQVFSDLIASVKFFSADQAGAGTCVISTDNTYGLSSDNPIRVGGGDFGGPPRERAYLDTLLGPNGETITYNRLGSSYFGEALLDVFEISGLDEKVTLYVDEYSYTEPLAPVGFTCRYAFPLSEPEE